ncbi:MAG: DUF3419 family protein [Myxococcota bacterium]
MAIDRDLYGALAFAESAESLTLTEQALAPTLGDRIAGITSSGDVLLMLAGLGASEVVGFDLNPVQTALAELKLAALRQVPIDEILYFLGIEQAPEDARLRTLSRLEDALSPAAREVWSSQRRAIGAGVLNHGMTYLIIRAMVGALRRLVDQDALALFLGERGSDEDRRRALDGLRGRSFTRHVLEPALARFAAQLKWVFFPHTICRVSSRPDEMIRDFFDTFAPLFVHGGMNNPVLSRAATGVLHGSWEKLLYNPARAELLESSEVRFETRTITDGLSRLPAGWATKIYLSNAPDYLEPQELWALAKEIRRAARPGARVLYVSLCNEDRLGEAFGPLIDHRELSRIRALDDVFLYPSISVRTVGGAA